MKCQIHLQVQQRLLPQFHLLRIILHTFMHWQLHDQMQLKCNLKCTFQCNLSCTFLCTFIQIVKCTYSCISRCIIRSTLNCTIKRTSNAFIVVSFALSRASLGAPKTLLLLSLLNWPDFASICTFKSIFESILKCVVYTLSFAISVTFWGSICDFLVQFQVNY